MKLFKCLLYTLSAALLVIPPVHGDETGNSTTAEQTPPEAAQSTANSSADAAPADSEAPTVAPIDTGNTAWMMVSNAFVLMMTLPGLALFYGGLVRRRNILSVMMQCVFLMGLMTTVWVIVGFSFAFGGSNPYIGDFSHVFLSGKIPVATGSTDAVASDQLFALFQGMFFIITPALICGAFAERMKFSAMCVFSVLWGLLIYCPIAHWVWSDAGWLCEWNKDAAFPALDFAGGTVVHISSGVSALVCALFIGPRKGFGSEPMPPHNLTYTCAGTGLLWMGWFGFNGGSALAANGLAANALVVTHVAAAAGLIGWSVMELIRHKKATVLGACSGAVAGLVCITPASGSVTAPWALVMGLAGGIICFFACTNIKNAFAYDDALDAFGIHGVGGMLGAILTGVFAVSAVTGERGGVIDGNPGQLIPQVVSVIAAAAVAAVGTVILLSILKPLMGLRVEESDEIRGLDVALHGEEGYILH